MKSLFPALIAVAVAVFAGCSTPETRIQQNPETFAKLGAPEQQLIREGRVAIGFTPEMVRLALGDPDRVALRTDASGVNEAWSYITYETDDGILLYRGYYHRYGCPGGAIPSYYMNYPSRREREYFKVVFAGGRVVAIEQQT